MNLRYTAETIIYDSLANNCTILHGLYPLNQRSYVKRPGGYAS